MLRRQNRLLLYNNSLGYKVECAITNFKYNTYQEHLRFSIKPKFTELEPESETQKILWDKNREKAYYGSVTNLFKSLKEGGKEFENDGFDLSLTYRTADLNEGTLVGGFNLEHADSILKKGDFPKEHFLKFDDKLMVEYYHPISNIKQVSWLELNYSYITIDEFGYPEEFNPYKWYGYWGENGVANLLPKYFAENFN